MSAGATRCARGAMLALGLVLPERSNAQAGTAAATATQADAAAPPPSWIATLSSGVIARDGDDPRPYVVAGLSRKLGRGYVRVAATGFRSALRQIDATLPSSFAIVSLGGGGTFGRWFVDGYASAGRQFYGGVTTPLGTRRSSVGSGSGVYGAALSGGRFVALTRRLFLTPSLSVQYSIDRALRSSLTPSGPSDREAVERAWTGGATVRLDRFFGRSSQHLVGVAFSRVQTTNGATILTGGAGVPAAVPIGVGDGWFVIAPAASLRVASRLWIDMSATRTLGARAGNYSVGLVGLRFGF